MMIFFRPKNKRSIGSNNGNTYALLNINSHKDLKDSQYNSKVGIIGMLAVIAVVVVSVLGIIFFNPLMYHGKGKGKRRR